MLNRVLGLYETEDILLKMNIVEVVSTLGEGKQSAELLYNHKIWKVI